MSNSFTKQGQALRPGGTTFPNNYDMIVFCHLRWQFVYQRPQHIISRMAKDLKVLMVEEPIPHANGETDELLVITPNLHVLQPHVNDIESIAPVLAKYAAGKSVEIGWFYSAAFSPLLSSFSFGTIVYDCMDELALFKGASSQLIDQEKYLIASADVVFTGGKSLYESKSQMHEKVYCFPSSVDEAHFATALNGISVPEDIARIPGPIVGYFGVIDERIDYELLAGAAELLPQVSLVMIGPLAKVSADELPKASNIYYLGMKDYSDLPNYLKAFDIAMMPFALNDATKYISPTKTLEYMAAGKPIVSTRIKDVVRDYAGSVHFAENPSEFAGQVSRLLQQRNTSETAARYREILDNTSWDATASKMKAILNEFAR